MTPDEFVLFCNELSEAVEDKDSYIITPLWDLVDIFQSRIFDKGKNTEGTQIGVYWNYYSPKYNDSWPNVRQAYGRQIDYVDLQFEGKLRDSIQLTRTPDRSDYSIWFDDEEEAKKADFQEHLQGWKAGKGPKRKSDKKYESKKGTEQVLSTKPMQIFSIANKEYKDFTALLDKAFEQRISQVMSKYQ